MKPRLEESHKIKRDIILKVNDETYEALRSVATENGMASAQYVRSLLCIHLNKLRKTDAIDGETA